MKWIAKTGLLHCRPDFIKENFTTQTEDVSMTSLRFPLIVAVCFQISEKVIKHHVLG